MSPPNRTATIEDILRDHSPAVRDACSALRSLVLVTVPDAEERVYPTWHGIGYRHPRVGYFCAIFPLHEHVLLSFEFGILLPDPDRILNGNGRQVRAVDIPTGSEIPRKAIIDLIQAALNLPPSMQARRMMVAGKSAGTPPAQL